MDALALQSILGRAPGLTAQQLLSALERREREPHGIGALEALLGAPARMLRALGLSPSVSAWLHAPDGALIAADRAWIERERVVLIDALSASYPPLLARISAAPALLYVRGDPEALRAPQLAIVGSRAPTVPGRRTALAFAGALTRDGLTITSGLALGIDGASHEGALAAGGRTVAVLAAGLDRIYPPQHARLAARIAGNGALVSPFPRGTAPRRLNFRCRNRVISGLSLGTLVVEAARCSGSLLTARCAREQGRAVFAIPGSIDNPLAHGCHALIRAGAMLVENTADVLAGLGNSFHKQDDNPGIHGRDDLAMRLTPLDKGHKILLDALGFAPASVNALVERTGFPTQSVTSMLLFLELAGAVGSEAEGRYVRLVRRARPG